MKIRPGFAFILCVILLAGATLACQAVTGIKDLTPTSFPSSHDAEILDHLALSHDPGQLRPGESLTMTVGLNKCCYYFEPVEADVRWSIAPSQGASIDPITGVLTIDPDTPGNTTYTLQADIENGRRILTTRVFVFSTASNPLAGTWHEQSQLTCETGAILGVSEPIREMIFTAARTFSVTWMPFEIYRDYWGTYTYDQAAHTITMLVESGNFVPPALDLQGQFMIDAQGMLHLQQIWLGSKTAGSPVNCGHIFSK